MTVVWTYPWAFAPATIDDELAELAEMGVDGLTVAGHYHSIQTLLPPRTDTAREPSRGDGTGRGVFASYPGGCHFEPDPEYFEATSLDPPVNDSGPDGRDAFGLVADAAGDHDLDVNAWTVCLHNSRLGAANPDYRIESAFGDAHDHALCPSHEAVRAYYAGVVGNLRDYDVARIDLESIGYSTALHGHGHRFGHLKNHVVTTDAGRVLLSQCFCEGCRAAAAEHAVDFDAARSLVRDLLRDGMRGPTAELPPLDELADRYEPIRSLLSFRAAVVERFVRRLAAASGPVPLHYYLADGLGYVPSAVEPAGVRLESLGDHLDSVTAICYTDSPETARERVGRARAAFDGPVNAGVTLDPAVVPDEAAFRAVSLAGRDAATGGLEVFNYSLMGETQVGWLDRVA